MAYVIAPLVAASPNATSNDAWYESLGGWLGNVAEILTAVVLAATILGAIWQVYKRTFGRRRDRKARLRRLGTSAQISFFSTVLSEPPAMRRTEDATITRYDDEGNEYQAPKKWVECVWIDRDYYVHGVADEDETIHAYSVTTRSKRFHPSFRQPGGFAVERGRVARLLRLSSVRLHPKVKLGKTRFHELGRPEQAASWIGARNAHYYEASYWGNPGYYQTFVYSINDAGYVTWEGWDYDNMHDFAWGTPDPVDPKFAAAVAAAAADADESDLEDEAGEAELAEMDGEGTYELGEYFEEPLPAFYDEFRRRARVNTYTVIGAELGLADYPYYARPPDLYPTIFGVNSDRVRTLAGERE